ncbi:uncharacterized protein LOC135497663 [Lineus longissimus]|uniref:uncharacterized protein LOC135497663 n=1 Tax=Lineus longissimus TaxID=88925 RepID=UPI00315DAE25
MSIGEESIMRASGNSQQSVADSYRIGKSTISGILYETCEALWTVLKDDFVAVPTQDDCIRIAAENWQNWNFPMCLGSIDGKHVAIKAPPRSGSDYFNYKKYHSIILMAVADGKYRFRMVDIGAYGRESDGGVFSRSQFGIKMDNDTLGIPESGCLPGTDIKVPYMFLGDEAFPLKKNLMRPYAGTGLDYEHRVFNYRLSRNRRCVENAFGIPAARWRIFRGPIEVKPENVDVMVKATIALHNFLLANDGHFNPRVRYVPPQFVDFIGEDGELKPGQWREITKTDTDLQEVGRLGANVATRQATKIRDILSEYFQTNH